MRHGIVVCAFVLAAGLLLNGDLSAGNLEPPGPPAPTMKTLSQVEARIPITSLPLLIASPGNYYLTGDLTGVAGQYGIGIASSFVTIDLNGFALIGVPGSFDGIRADVGGTRHLVIRNGVIRNWGQSGIAADIPTEVHVEDLRLRANGGNGLMVGARSIVRNTTSSGNAVNGIVTFDGGSIVGCTAGSNTQSGVVAGVGSVVSDTTASNNGASGISLSAAAIATDCTALQNNIGFLLSSEGRVIHSVARQNVVGISGVDGVSVEECTVHGNTDDGIRVANRGLVRGNYARGNTNDGIHATGNENRIEENQVTQNFNGAGIRVSGLNNLIVKNSASANMLEYSIAGGNQFASASVNPNTATPWANFDL